MNFFVSFQEVFLSNGLQRYGLFLTSKFFRIFFEYFFYFCLRNSKKAPKVGVKTIKMTSYWQIFLTFAKIGAFTIGGGYAMLPIIQNEIVRKGWLKEEDFTDIVALAQSAPGLLAVNISIFTGHKLRGTKGSIIATLGSILPSFIIILAIAMLFSGYQDNPIVVKIFKGISFYTYHYIFLFLLNYYFGFSIV